MNKEVKRGLNNDDLKAFDNMGKDIKNKIIKYFGDKHLKEINDKIIGYEPGLQKMIIDGIMDYLEKDVIINYLKNEKINILKDFLESKTDEEKRELLSDFIEMYKEAYYKEKFEKIISKRENNKKIWGDIIASYYEKNKNKNIIDYASNFFSEKMGIDLKSIFNKPIGGDDKDALSHDSDKKIHEIASKFLIPLNKVDAKSILISLSMGYAFSFMISSSLTPVEMAIGSTVFPKTIGQVFAICSMAGVGGVVISSIAPPLFSVYCIKFSVDLIKNDVKKEGSVHTPINSTEHKRNITKSEGRINTSEALKANKRCGSSFAERVNNSNIQIIVK